MSRDHVEDEPQSWLHLVASRLPAGCNAVHDSRSTTAVFNFCTKMIQCARCCARGGACFTMAAKPCVCSRQQPTGLRTNQLLGETVRELVVKFATSVREWLSSAVGGRPKIKTVGSHDRSDNGRADIVEVTKGERTDSSGSAGQSRRSARTARLAGLRQGCKKSAWPGWERTRSNTSLVHRQ